MRSPQFRSYLDSTSNGVLVRWHGLALIPKKAFQTFSACEFACHMLRFASPSGRSITPNIYHNTLKMCTCDSFRFVFFLKHTNWKIAHNFQWKLEDRETKNTSNEYNWIRLQRIECMLTTYSRKALNCFK